MLITIINLGKNLLRRPKYFDLRLPRQAGRVLSKAEPTWSVAEPLAEPIGLIGPPLHGCAADKKNQEYSCKKLANR